MFTQQKKGWAGWSPSPRVGDGPDGGSAPVNARSAGGLSLGKGKGKGKSVVGALPPPPLQASLGENGSDAAGGVGDVEVWRRFREAGLLDESVLQKKEKEALVQRISELETEGHVEQEGPEEPSENGLVMESGDQEEESECRDAVGLSEGKGSSGEGEKDGEDDEEIHQSAEESDSSEDEVAPRNTIGESSIGVVQG